MSAICVGLTRRSSKQRYSASSSSKMGGPQTRRTHLRVPPAKIVQAEALLAQGHSQRSVSRALHISEHTVAKIIKAEDFQSFLKSQRERLFALAPMAIESFRAQLARDGRLAYVFLKDLGVVPSREERLKLTTAPTQTIEPESLIDRQTRLIAAVIAERHRVFGIELPDEMKQAIEKSESGSSACLSERGEE